MEDQNELNRVRDLRRASAGEVAASSVAAEKPVGIPAGEIMSKDDLDKLDRDMRTKRPEDVTLPGGRKLSDIIAERDAADAEDGKAASILRDEAFARETSANEPAEGRVIVTKGGQVVTAPIGLPDNPEPEDKAPAK